MQYAVQEKSTRPAGFTVDTACRYLVFREIEKWVSPGGKTWLASPMHKQKIPCFYRGFIRFGGRERIRTSGTVARTSDFESGAFNHSATLPTSVDAVFMILLDRTLPTPDQFTFRANQTTNHARSRTYQHTGIIQARIKLLLGPHFRGQKLTPKRNVESARLNQTP